ncbi:MAG: ECF transporter S component [Elusimicrobia bacterium]|nr:ECF transporter S component [Elusimicrobiota bacterium]
MQNILTLKNNTLNWTEKRAVFFQALLLIAALALPSVCHMLNLPVNKILPMHWPVLLAGLVYGWRSGLLLGVAAPLISFGLSGMPEGTMLGIMVCELAVYGFAAGIFAEKFKLNYFVSVTAALICGKILFAVLSGGAGFLSAGVYAFLTQIVILPVLAYRWTKNS